jgi:hypothetical protein
MVDKKPIPKKSLTYKQKRSKALKEKHEQLNFDEPFTQREARGLGKQNQAFIRDIQISRRISKDEALKLYAEKNMKGKKALQKLMNETKTKIKDHYNQKHQFRVQTDKEFEAPIQKAKVKREKQQAKDFKSWLRKEKREIRFYLASQKFRNTPTYAKVKRGHKTYPDATKYELTHGVNSQASKKFRVEHGLNEEYSGKVVK